MAKNRIIFYSLFGAYQIAGFIFTVVIDSNSSALFSMAGFVSWFKYLSFVGVLLIIVDVIWSLQQSRKVKKELEASRHENNTLKARIYDLQETKKEVSTAGSK